MQFFRSLSARTVRSLVVLLLLAFTPVASLNAAMIGTDSLLENQQNQQNQIERDQIIERIQAEDAQKLLGSMGVDATEIEKRIASMTPEELAQFNAQIDELPAGGVGVFGLIVFILLLMIVLDLLGAVDFFPAIKTIHY
jgi:hypothetical protein